MFVTVVLLCSELLSTSWINNRSTSEGSISTEHFLNSKILVLLDELHIKICCRLHH